MTTIEMINRWLDRYKQASTDSTAKAKALRYMNRACEQIWLGVPSELAYFREQEATFTFIDATDVYLVDSPDIVRIFNVNGTQLHIVPVGAFSGFYREHPANGHPTRYAIDGSDILTSTRKIAVRVWPTPIAGNGAGTGKIVTMAKLNVLASDSDISYLPEVAHEAAVMKALELAALDDNSQLASLFAQEAASLLGAFLQLCKTKGDR